MSISLLDEFPLYNKTISEINRTIGSFVLINLGRVTHERRGIKDPSRIIKTHEHSILIHSFEWEASCPLGQFGSYSEQKVIDELIAWFKNKEILDITYDHQSIEMVFEEAKISIYPYEKDAELLWLSHYEKDNLIKGLLVMNDFSRVDGR
jgi:hypothetical protein